MAELKDVCKDFTPDKKIKSKLIEIYGKKIVITTKNRSLTIICFTDVQHDLLNKAWYEKKSNEKEEHLRILERAAAIIREDIRSVVVDNTN